MLRQRVCSQINLFAANTFAFKLMDLASQISGKHQNPGAHGLRTVAHCAKCPVGLFLTSQIRHFLDSRVIGKSMFKRRAIQISLWSENFLQANVV